MVAPSSAPADEAARTADLVAALSGPAGGAVVITDAVDGEPTEGVLGLLRASGRPTVATVDSAGSSVGSVATVLALAAALEDRRPAAYGFGADADAVLPE